MRLSLEKQELSLVYQPVLALASEKIVGMEVFLRWKHPDLGEIAPSEFIPIAEETGMILAIGTWVLKMACTQYMIWCHAHNLILMINLSAKQLKDPGFVALVKHILDETHMPPEYLEFDLRETIVMDRLEELETVLTDLHDLGIKIAIDNFGTGHASLSRLKALPIQILKIDRSFITEVADNHENLIVSSIIGLAKGLKLELIAEGVETETQERFLRTHGCQMTQGFYYQEPLSTNEMGDLLQKISKKSAHPMMKKSRPAAVIPFTRNTPPTH